MVLEKETWPVVLEFGRSLWPTRPLRWLTDGENFLLMPATSVIGSASSGFSTIYDIFLVGSDGIESAIGGSDTCMILDVGMSTYRDRLEAISIEGDCQQELRISSTASKGIAISSYEFFPWLDAADFSPNEQYLVAEAYTAADDPADVILEGVTLVDLRWDERYPLVEDARQPVWRPVNPVVARYAQAGERVGTLDSPLQWDDDFYHFHYLTTNQQVPLSFNWSAARTGFARPDITAWIVTRNEKQVVRDPEMLYDLFMRYRAAHALYVDAPPIEIPIAPADELDSILNNPLMIAMSPAPALGRWYSGKESQYAEALRLLLTARLDDDPASQALQESLSQVEEGVNRGEKLYQIALNFLDNWEKFIPKKVQAKQEFQSILGNAEIAGILDATSVRFLVHLLQISHLEETRAAWLIDYIDAFEQGEPAFDRNQILAAVAVLEEVDDNSQQRLHRAEEFLRDEALGKLLAEALETRSEAALTKLAEHLAEKGITRLSTKTVGSALATFALALEANSLLFSSDRLYEQFLLAQRSLELHERFRAGRVDLEQQAQHTTNKAWDAELAWQYRSALLLESLAAEQSLNAYINGIAAVTSLPNPAELVEWFRSEDWDALDDKMAQLANSFEHDFIEPLASPAGLTEAIQLSVKLLPTDPYKVNHLVFPKLHSAWTSYTNSDAVYDMLIIDNMLWMATTGGVVRWNLETDEYTLLTSEYGLPSHIFLAMLQSEDGALWFGTLNNDGVSRLSADGAWTTTYTYIERNRRLYSYFDVAAMLESEDGDLWFGTRTGVNRTFTDGLSKFYTTDGDVEAILQSREGDLWFGTWGGVSRLSTDGKWQSYTTDEGLVHNNVRAILESEDGTLWFGTDEGVSRLSTDGKWATYTTDDGLSANEILALLESEDGILWFGTSEGVSRLSTDGVWKLYTTDDGLSDNVVRTMLQGEDGDLWFGTDDGGVSRLSTARFYHKKIK